MLSAQIRVAFLVSRFKKNCLSFIFLPIVHLVLVELFASTHYLVYFLILFSTLYILNFKRLFLSNKMLFLLLIYMSGIFFLLKLFEDKIYDLYIDMNMTFELSYISYEVCCVLTLIHVFILFLLGYNRVKTI